VNNPTPTTRSPTPWHLWPVGVLALLWNSVGAFDYLMTETRNASYMSSFTHEQLVYFNSFPAWVVAAWALSVWGGVLGSVLLLFRKRQAVPTFGVSLAMLIPTSFYNFVLTDGFAIMGGLEALLFTALIFVGAIALLIYARRLARGGVLR
jgi:hypothetical protein